MKGDDKKQKPDAFDNHSVASEGSNCVIVANVEANIANEKMIRLAWDTGASITCTSDITFIEKSEELREIQTASGLGGKRNIPHSGISKTFDGIHMNYIENGQTPNLLSIARSLKSKEDGNRKYAIFSTKGAVHVEADETITILLDKIDEHAECNNLILGMAAAENNVYYQEFEDKRVAK